MSGLRPLDVSDRALREAKEEHRAVDSLVLPDLKVTDPSTVHFRARQCLQGTA